MGTGEDVRDMTPAAYCKRQAQGDADARTDVTEGTAAGEATRVGAGSTAAIPYAEAGLLTMSPRGPTFELSGLRRFWRSSARAMGWGQTGTWGGRRQATEGRSPRSSRATRSRRREARRGIGFPLNRPRTERKGWCYLGHHSATAVALQRNVFGHHGAKAVARRGQSAVRRQPTTDWRDALRQHRSLCEDRLARQGDWYPVWRGAQQSALAIRRLKCRERLTSTPEPCNDRRTICAHHGEPQRSR